MQMPEQIPLFPLNTVLCPGGDLPLQIFETRYVEMVRDCLRDGLGFGINAILEGQEVGDPSVQVAKIGTYATITDFKNQPNGLLGIVATGQRRFRVTDSWTSENGLRLAHVTPLPLPTVKALPDQQAWLAELSLSLHAQRAEPSAAPDATPDSDWVANRLTEWLPLPLALKQELLETDDPHDRLVLLARDMSVEFQGRTH